MDDCIDVIIVDDLME